MQRPSTNGPSRQVSTKVDVEFYALLNRIAKEKDKTMSWMVRYLLQIGCETFLEREDSDRSENSVGAFGRSEELISVFFTGYRDQRELDMLSAQAHILRDKNLDLVKRLNAIDKKMRTIVTKFGFVP
jgi:hypothetical protein